MTKPLICAEFFNQKLKCPNSHFAVAFEAFGNAEFVVDLVPYAVVADAAAAAAAAS